MCALLYMYVLTLDNICYIHTLGGCMWKRSVWRPLLVGSTIWLDVAGCKSDNTLLWNSLGRVSIYIRLTKQAVWWWTKKTQCQYSENYRAD